jgi:hypothetical protein
MATAKSKQNKTASTTHKNGQWIADQKRAPFGGCYSSRHHPGLQRVERLDPEIKLTHQIDSNKKTERGHAF